MVFWLPCFGLASAWFSAASPRPRQCCLGLGLGLVKTATPTSLIILTASFQPEITWRLLNPDVGIYKIFCEGKLKTLEESTYDILTKFQRLHLYIVIHRTYAYTSWREIKCGHLKIALSIRICSWKKRSSQRVDGSSIKFHVIRIP